jgi:hypothetical protein
MIDQQHDCVVRIKHSIGGSHELALVKKEGNVTIAVVYFYYFSEQNASMGQNVSSYVQDTVVIRWSNKNERKRQVAPWKQR